MLTHLATPEDVAQWKQTAERYRGRLLANRISGSELYAYLQSRYPLLPLDDAHANQVVVSNILENDCFASELPPGALPEPVCCIIENKDAGAALYRAQDELFSGCEIFVGIDLVSGFFAVEGSSLLWDELFAHRGLSERDLANSYLVAEYVACLTRFGLLEQTLAN
ncbi:MAG: hypothetical protein VB062_02165 [Christensenella sp.]|nr:hypothetical protein [Christensenella sp.]